MKTLPLILVLMTLPLGCGPAKESYAKSFDFKLFQPSVGKVDSLIQKVPALDPGGLYLRKTVTYQWEPMNDGKLEGLLAEFVKKVKRDLENKGYSTEVHNYERTVRHIKYKAPQSKGTLSILARKGSPSWKMEITILEVP